MCVGDGVGKGVSVGTAVAGGAGRGASSTQAKVNARMRPSSRDIERCCQEAVFFGGGALENLPWVSCGPSK